MYSKNLPAISLGVLLAVAFSLCCGTAECHNLANKSTFNESDTGIYVLCQSTYSEFVSITNTTLLTLDCNGSILEGGITVNNSLNSAIKNCIFKKSLIGIDVLDSMDIVIENSTFNNRNSGVILNGVLRGALRNNIFIDSKLGQGVALINTSSIAVDTNIFRTCKIGLYLELTSQVTITLENRFENNIVGLSLENSSGNKVFRNIFIKSIGGTTSKVSGSQSKNNVWDIGEEGNYWSDYDVMLDKNKDGVGDKAYLITQDLDVNDTNQDNFPFVNENLEKTEGVPIAENLGHFSSRSGTYTFKKGGFVTLSCGENDTYLLTLQEQTPITFSVDGISLSLTKSVRADLNSDGLADLNIQYISSDLRGVTVKLIRLDPCVHYCGDGVCNSWETETCLVDCEGKEPVKDEEEEELGVLFWILLIVFIVIVFVLLGVLTGKKRRDASYNGQLHPNIEAPKPKPEAKRETIDKIVDYAEDYFAKGYSAAEVKKMLLAGGWESSDIDAAIKEFIGREASSPQEESET